MRRALIPAIAVVAVACSAFTPTPTRTTIPTPTEFVIPTPTPKPSPTAFTGHYGFLVSGPNGYTVRAEGSDASLGVINLFAGAVSPDGRLFAGWTRTTPTELRIVDVSKPAAFSQVLSLPASEGGGRRFVVLASTNEALVRWFRSDDPGFIVERHGDILGSGASAAGRPQSSQVAAIIDRQILLFDGSGQRIPLPSEDLFGIVGFRFDGSAAIVKTATGLALFDIATWKLTPVSGDVRFGVRLP